MNRNHLSWFLNEVLLAGQVSKLGNLISSIFFFFLPKGPPHTQMSEANAALGKRFV